jgi:hypothetical protein
MSRSDPEVSVTTVEENGGVKPLDFAVDRMNDKWSVLSPAGGMPLKLKYLIYLSCYTSAAISHDTTVLKQWSVDLFLSVRKS